MVAVAGWSEGPLVFFPAWQQLSADHALPDVLARRSYSRDKQALFNKLPAALACCCSSFSCAMACSQLTVPCMLRSFCTAVSVTCIFQLVI
jgi:hypothetical protein